MVELGLSSSFANPSSKEYVIVAPIIPQQIVEGCASRGLDRSFVATVFNRFCDFTRLRLYAKLQKRIDMPRPTEAQMRFLTPEEAAEYLRLSPRTIERYRYMGSGPRFRRFGRVIRYTVWDLDVWADTRSYLMTDDAPLQSNSETKR